MKQKENVSKEVFFSKAWQPFPWHKEAPFPKPPKLIIVSATPGATISKEQNPHLPITPEAIVSNHVLAYKAGASIAHVHVRDESGRPFFNPELFKRIILEIKAKCPDMLVDASLSHPHSDDSVEARLEPFFKLGLPVELGTISAGTFHTIGQDIYVNRETYLKAAVTYLQERNVKPVITPYNIKQIEGIKKWAVETGLVKRPLLNLSYGLYGEPATRDIFRLHLTYLPEKCDWIVEAAGRNWLPLTVEAILCGGHVRAGMEDSIYMYPHKNDLIKSSVEVVNKVRRIAEELGRDIASPAETRKILKI
jgi:3-keto-5-aminohexanoate cleavage enzyme